MKNISSYINESIFSKHQIESLTDEELNYKFKHIYKGKQDVRSIIRFGVEHYKKDPDELMKEYKEKIALDKILSDADFSDSFRASVTNPDNEDTEEYSSLNNVYVERTKVNSKGYCVIFDPCLANNAPYSFLVCSAPGSKSGTYARTLKPIEFIEPNGYEKDIHEHYDEFDCLNRVFFDDFRDAWEYIENKYGKF